MVRKVFFTLTLSFASLSHISAWSQAAWLMDLEAAKSVSPKAAGEKCEALFLSKKLATFGAEDMAKIYHFCTRTDLYFHLDNPQKLKLAKATVHVIQHIFESKQKDNYKLLTEFSKFIERQLKPAETSLVVDEIFDKLKTVKIGNVGSAINFFILNEEVMNFAELQFSRLYVGKACDLSERFRIVGSIFPNSKPKLVRNQYLCMRALAAKGSYGEAIKIGEVLIGEMVNDSDFVYQFMIQIDLAVAYREVSNEDKSKIYFDKAAEILKANRRETLEAWLAVEMAENQKRKNIPRSSHQLLETALKLYRKRSSPFTNWALVRKASVYRMSGDVKSAAEYLGRVDFDKFADNGFDYTINLEYLFESLLLAFSNSKTDEWKMKLQELKSIVHDATLLSYYEELLSPLDLIAKSNFKKPGFDSKAFENAIALADGKYKSQYRWSEVKRVLQAKGF